MLLKIYARIKYRKWSNQT